MCSLMCPPGTILTTFGLLTNDWLDVQAPEQQTMRKGFKLTNQPVIDLNWPPVIPFLAKFKEQRLNRLTFITNFSFSSRFTPSYCFSIYLEHPFAGYARIAALFQVNDIFSAGVGQTEEVFFVAPTETSFGVIRPSYVFVYEIGKRPVVRIHNSQLHGIRILKKTMRQ
uniref:Uncharacterized protein n=1 Tax=Romanomermis culicivorax TaxID=13658 RepID=A0A915K079_ROMCU